MIKPLIALAATTLSLLAQDQQFGSKLPPPFATKSATNGPKVVDRPDGAALHVPDGFQIEEYASGFRGPRFMLAGPSGEILLSDMNAGIVYVLTGQPAQRKTLIERLDRPYGLALWKDYLYVGEPTSIKRYKNDAKTMTAGPGEQVIELDNFSKAHITRSLLFDRKGEKLYVGVGSGSNVAAPPDA